MVVEPRKMGQGRRRVAVLCSGGLDSAVLVAQQTQVLPVYVRSGLAGTHGRTQLIEAARYSAVH